MTYFDFEKGEGNPSYYFTQSYGILQNYDGTVHRESDYVDITELGQMTELDRMRHEKANLLEVIDNIRPGGTLRFTIIDGETLGS